MVKIPYLPHQFRWVLVIISLHLNAKELRAKAAAKAAKESEEEWLVIQKNNKAALDYVETADALTYILGGPTPPVVSTSPGFYVTKLNKEDAVTTIPQIDKIIDNNQHEQHIQHR